MDKIFKKNSCEMAHYRKILIPIIQVFFPSINKIFDFWGRLGTRL